MPVSVPNAELDQIEARIVAGDSDLITPQDLLALVREIRRTRAALAKKPIVFGKRTQPRHRRNRFFVRNPEYIPLAGRTLSVAGKIGRIRYKKLPHEHL